MFTIYKRDCALCGIEFQTYKKVQRCCSQSCGQKLSRKTKAERVLSQKSSAAVSNLEMKSLIEQMRNILAALESVMIAEKTGGKLF